MLRLGVCKSPETSLTPQGRVETKGRVGPFARSDSSNTDGPWSRPVMGQCPSCCVGQSIGGKAGVYHQAGLVMLGGWEVQLEGRNKLLSQSRGRASSCRVTLLNL